MGHQIDPKLVKINHDSKCHVNIIPFLMIFFPTQVSQNYSSKLASLDMLSEMRLAGWAKQSNVPNTLDLMVSWQRKPLISATS